MHLHAVLRYNDVLLAGMCNVTPWLGERVIYRRRTAWRERARKRPVVGVLPRALAPAHAGSYLFRGLAFVFRRRSTLRLPSRCRMSGDAAVDRRMCAFGFSGVVICKSVWNSNIMLSDLKNNGNNYVLKITPSHLISKKLTLFL